MTETKIIRVIYPLQSGRIVLRVDDDWNRDVEAASVDASRTTFEFHYATARPYLYFKPCIIDQSGFHWSKGSNYLAINGRPEIKSIYPHFFGDLGGAISAPIDFYMNLAKTCFTLRFPRRCTAKLTGQRAATFRFNSFLAKRRISLETRSARNSKEHCLMKILLWWYCIFIIAAQASAQEHPFKFPEASMPLVVDSLRREVRVLAVYHPGKFSGFLRFVPNYHLLVWDDGGAARESLFSTPVPDTTLIAALESLGAVAGNNLTMDAWDKRKDPKHPAPQTRIAGTPVEILVWWKGLSEPKPLAELLDDPGGRGLDFRFGGNRDLIHHWHSGCLVCLYSCPGSKVGNAAYTVRDYATGATKFSPRQHRLPKSGSEVAIIFRVRS